MNETHVTVAGRLVADPERRETKDGHGFATFRIASTIRRRTAEGEFVDGPTSFYNVAAYRALGENSMQSLRKGDPVVVHGRQQVHSWQRGDGSWGNSVEVDATLIGHDLTFGRSSLTRSSNTGPSPTANAAEPDARDSAGSGGAADEAEVLSLSA